LDDGCYQKAIVQVTDIAFMEIFQSQTNLMHNLRSFTLGKGSVCAILDPLKELSAFHAFHYNKQAFSAAVGVFKDIDNVHNVPTATDTPMELNFSPRFRIIMQDLRVR